VGKSFLGPFFSKKGLLASLPDLRPAEAPATRFGIRTFQNNRSGKDERSIPGRIGWTEKKRDDRLLSLARVI
jgi:hypothetical protein